MAPNSWATMYPSSSLPLKRLPAHKPEGNRGIEMAPGNMADCIGHGQNCQAEGQRYAGKTDAQLRKGQLREPRCRNRRIPAKMSREIPHLTCFPFAVSLQVDTIENTYSIMIRIAPPRRIEIVIPKPISQTLFRVRWYRESHSSCGREPVAEIAIA